MSRRTEATLSDVARASGVALSTASRVLNGEHGHRVAEGTRERVLDAARQLRYRPNAIARGLRTARTYTLGIAVPQLENPVPDPVRGCLRRRLRRAGTDVEPVQPAVSVAGEQPVQMPARDPVFLCRRGHGDLSGDDLQHDDPVLRRHARVSPTTRLT